MAPKTELELLPDPLSLALDGFDWLYRDMPGPETPAGAPLLLVHGFGGDLNAWYFNQGPLARSRRVIAPDLPGHGGSGLETGDGSPDHFARMMAGLLDHLQTGPVHVCGHSMGGTVSMALALNHPQHVASLTLVNSAGLGPELDMDWFRAYTLAPNAEALKACLQPLCADPALISDKMIAFAMSQRQRTAPALLKLAEPALQQGQQAWIYGPRLQELTCPAMIIHGVNDPVIPVSALDPLPGFFRQERLEQTGHMPPQENPQLFNSLLESFLADCDTGPAQSLEP